jgi:hypothetical protein
MNQEKKSDWKNVARSAWLPAVLLCGLAARFWIGTFGHNYDYDSERIIAGITRSGENVYASTDRYNYGPVWFQILHGLDLLSGGNEKVFRALVIGFLSAVDIGIFFALRQKFGRLAATLFFLNPVSIMITGYHNQFDNVALLLGFWSVMLFGDDFKKPIGRRKFFGLVVLGFSLMTKHLLFVFPLWLAVKQRGMLQKWIVLIVPPLIFLAGFLPYWSAGREGIIHNVFQYRSSTADFFYHFFMPGDIAYLANSQTVWIAFLILFAFICRKKNIFESLLIYTAVLVSTSPAMANQYLAIPAAFVSVYVNPFSICYILIAAVHIIADVNGPHLFKNFRGSYADLAVYCLFLALVWTMWREPIIRVLQKCRREINVQLGREE